MSGVISVKNLDLLKNVVRGDIDDYSIIVQESNKKGEGYLSEMCYVSLTDKRSGKSVNYIIKQAFSVESVREHYPIRKYFLNEIVFYTEVWTYFEKIQTDRYLATPFQGIPKCIVTSSELGHETLIFENLRFQNFQTYDKEKPFDERHIYFILKEYARFHAISFACQSINPEEYNKNTNKLENIYSDMAALEGLREYFNYLYGISLESMDSQKDEKAIDKFQRYRDNVLNILCSKNDYKGNYSVVLHGDCWSNNMMFKYDEANQLCDIRLLDFQLSKIGTPVHDISYLLYAGASKEILDRLDHYLNVYHHTLLETIEEFGLDSRDIYPFDELKKDWKQYCIPGFIMGIMLWRAKLTYTDSVKDLTDMMDDVTDTTVFSNSKFDIDSFNRIVRDLIVHMEENDFL